MPGKGIAERRHLFRLVKMIQARQEFLRADPHNDRTRWWIDERDSLEWVLKLIGITPADYSDIIAGTTPSWQVSADRGIENHLRVLRRVAAERRNKKSQFTDPPSLASSPSPNPRWSCSRCPTTNIPAYLDRCDSYHAPRRL